MEILIIIFGALIILAGIGMLIQPDFIFNYLKRESDNYKLHIFAIAIRLIIGSLLIYFAELSEYPVAMEALGWFTIIAAVALILIGHNNFRDLIEWAVTFLRPYRYIAGILAIFLGGFLMYAFL
jgi:hypothetical protein